MNEVMAKLNETIGDALTAAEQSMPIQNQDTPPHWNRHPNLLQIKSNYDFEVTVSPDNTGVVYDDEKLFIKMNSKMTFGVSYREVNRNEGLWLRAMIVFIKPAEMPSAVKRCANHRTSTASIENPSMTASIIKINDPKAMYLGTENGETFFERLSVLVPMEKVAYDEDGKVVNSVGVEFGCQNSCSSGINRRPTAIVFTLENHNCELLGKSVIEFKVCSCPKRDAEREREPKRKNDSKVPFPRGKKPKYERPPQEIKREPDSESDSNENPPNEPVTTYSMTTLPNISVPTEMVPDIMKYMFNIVAGKIVEGNDPGQHLQRCLKEIRKQRRRFEGSTAN